MLTAIVSSQVVQTMLLGAVVGFALGGWLDIWGNQDVDHWIRGEGFFTVGGILIGAFVGILAAKAEGLKARQMRFAFVGLWVGTFVGAAATPAISRFLWRYDDDHILKTAIFVVAYTLMAITLARIGARISRRRLPVWAIRVAGVVGAGVGLWEALIKRKVVASSTENLLIVISVGLLGAILGKLLARRLDKDKTSQVDQVQSVVPGQERQGNSAAPGRLALLLLFSAGILCTFVVLNGEIQGLEAGCKPGTGRQHNLPCDSQVGFPLIIAEDVGAGSSPSTGWFRLDFGDFIYTRYWAFLFNLLFFTLPFLLLLFGSVYVRAARRH